MEDVVWVWWVWLLVMEGVVCVAVSNGGGVLVMEMCVVRC